MGDPKPDRARPATDKRGNERRAVLGRLELKVTTSKWSVIAGVPVAVLGLAYFVVMTILVAITSQSPALRVARLVGASAGVLMVIYLVYIELFQVNTICLWCTGVHVLTLVLFGAVLWRDATPAPA